MRRWTRWLAALALLCPSGASATWSIVAVDHSTGAEAGGDARCLPEQAALSAFLMVAAPGDAPGSPSLRLVFPEVGEPPGLLRMLGGELVQRWRRYRGEMAKLAPGEPERNPVRALRRLYDARRSAAAPHAAALRFWDGTR